MNLSELKARGALVQAPPVKKEVTWQPTDPESGQPVGEPVTFDVFVKRPSAGWLDRARTAAARSANGISYRSALLSHAIVFGEKQDEQLHLRRGRPAAGVAGRGVVRRLSRGQRPAACTCEQRRSRGRLRKKFGADAWYWHQLVRAGVGGRSIEQARETLSEHEAFQWSRYMEAFGPLDWGERIFKRLDAGLALLAALAINRTGGLVRSPGAKGEAVNPRDFMWEPPPEPVVELTPEQQAQRFAMELGGGFKVKQAKEN